MDEQQYLEFTRSVDKENGLEFYALGLCEEAGEVAGKIKRIHRDDNDELTFERTRQLIIELGDLLWYFTRIVDYIDTTMPTVRYTNRQKLEDRVARNTLKGDGDNR